MVLLLVVAAAAAVVVFGAQPATAALRPFGDPALTLMLDPADCFQITNLTSTLGAGVSLQAPFPFTCYPFTPADRARIAHGEPAAAVCTSHPNNAFSGGNNTHFPGCGTCSCCRRLSPAPVLGNLFRLNYTVLAAPDAPPAAPPIVGTAVLGNLSPECKACSVVDATNSSLALAFVFAVPTSAGNTSVTVTVNMTVVQPSGAIHLQAAVDLPPGTLVRPSVFTLPALDNLDFSPHQRAVLLPSDYGYRVVSGEGWLPSWPQPVFSSNDAAAREFHWGPNGGNSQLPFTAVVAHNITQQPATGLYIGQHDPSGSLRTLLLAAPHPNLLAVHPVYGLACPSPTHCETPAPVVLQAFANAVNASQPATLFDAAQIYRRDFVELQVAPWTRGGNLSAPARRAALAPLVATTPLWVTFHGDQAHGTPADAVANLTAFQALLASTLRRPVELAVHYYVWTQQAFDTNYPVYTPVPGFAQAVAALQARSPPIHVIPYINGRLFDPRLDIWVAENASAAACRAAYAPNASDPFPLYQEVYEAGRDWAFRVMNPSTAYWQAKLAAVARNITASSGVHGLYVDQISCAGALACYNVEAPVLFDTASWVRGNRRVLQGMRQAMPPHTLLISEAQSEPYVDLVDVNLAIYGFDADNPVPAFQHVFSGWTLLMGTRFPYPFDSPTFRARLALMLTFGVIPAWFSVQDILPRLQDPANAADLALLAAVVGARLDHADMLNFGRMLRPVEIVEGDVPVVTTSDNHSVPQLLCNGWGNATQSLLLAANHGPTPLNVSVRWFYLGQEGEREVAVVDSLTVAPFSVVAKSVIQLQ